MDSREQALRIIREAYRKGEVTLYLGAGVSVASGLTTWDKLVLAMYFSALSKESLGQPFPNYLYAIAEWHLGRVHEPLEITARKIRQYYADEDAFLRHLHETLYAGFVDVNGGPVDLDSGAIRDGNRTLDAVAKMCERKPRGQGVKSVITYNYDGLLELALRNYPFQSICECVPLEPGKLPIYHVHGYVPMRGKGSGAGSLVFTEEQYHLAAQDTYSWANLVQIQCMSSSTGLMIGLSMSDRNMRRLLDAVSRTPVDTRNYALMQTPKWQQLNNSELELIDAKAREYVRKYQTSGIKRRFGYDAGVKGPTWQEQITSIVNEVQRVDVEQQTSVLEDIGIRPIWYENHDEIPGLINEILKE